MRQEAVRVTADADLVYAYCESSGHALSDVTERFGVRPTVEREECTLEWHASVYGYRCSACGRITHGTVGERFNFCPQCGARSK